MAAQDTEILTGRHAGAEKMTRLSLGMTQVEAE